MWVASGCFSAIRRVMAASSSLRRSIFAEASGPPASSVSRLLKWIFTTPSLGASKAKQPKPSWPASGSVSSTTSRNIAWHSAT